MCWTDSGMGHTVLSCDRRERRPQSLEWVSFRLRFVWLRNQLTLHLPVWCRSAGGGVACRTPTRPSTCRRTAFLPVFCPADNPPSGGVRCFRLEIPVAASRAGPVVFAARAARIGLHAVSRLRVPVFGSRYSQETARLPTATVLNNTAIPSLPAGGQFEGISACYSEMPYHGFDSARSSSPASHR